MKSTALLSSFGLKRDSSILQGKRSFGVILELKLTVT